jgi:hypothetical protein
MNWRLRWPLDPVILPNVASVAIFAAGLLRIARLNRLKTSARKLPLSRSVTGNRFSSAELIV